MNIGQIAQQTFLSAKMIRYYEEIGLLNDVKRTEAGYRVYSQQHVRTLKFIRHAKSLHFSFEQIKELLQLWQNHHRQSAEVKQLALKHIDQLNKQIAEMQEMVDILSQTAQCCAGNESADCPILEKLERGIREK